MGGKLWRGCFGRSQGVLNWQAQRNDPSAAFLANTNLMAVQCAKCGEELMGAVNRCWRCGQEFATQSANGELPPIRRAPVVAGEAAVFVAEFSEPSLDQAKATRRRPFETRGSLPHQVRRGSPFGDRGTATLTIAAEVAIERPDASVDLQFGNRPDGGALASAGLAFPLSLVSFAAAFLFPLAGALLGLLGLGFGVWGLRSRRRGLAIAGLLLCCLSLTISIAFAVIDIYVSFYGVAPWETNATLP